MLQKSGWEGIRETLIFYTKIAKNAKVSTVWRFRSGPDFAHFAFFV
ncbi:hypothetical protein OPIT5_20930 [Opitutaceae bacterium TAV5]|nr:hypothetical protein OPIT5_20930 [Opitutaceae bacterium TAV5]